MVKPGDSCFIIDLYGEGAHGEGLVLKKLHLDPEPGKYRVLVGMESMVLYFEPERILNELQYKKLLRDISDESVNKWKC